MSKLALITNRKSHMGFRLVQKSVTLNDLERRNGHYFALFRRIGVSKLWPIIGQIFAVEMGVPQFNALAMGYPLRISE